MGGNERKGRVRGRGGKKGKWEGGEGEREGGEGKRTPLSKCLRTKYQ